MTSPDPAQTNKARRHGGAGPFVIDIPTLFDDRPVGGYQRWVLILLGLTVVLDGFDVQSIGYIAPAVVRDWGVPASALGPVFGAGLLGMLLGSLALSVLADRVGRRPVLIGTTAFFALGMLATTRVASIEQLRALRFVTGFGLGGIMPNAMALAGEWSPRRRRVTLMMLVSCGFTGGAVLGGLIAAVLIPSWGWRSVFAVGGIIPFVIAGMMVFVLPESLQFLAERGGRDGQIDAWLGRALPGHRTVAGARYSVSADRTAGVPVAELFRDGRARTTTLLWITAFLDLLTLYSLSSWLPTLAQGAGLSTREAVLLGTTLQLGGVAGTVVMGPLIDRAGFQRVLVPSLLAAGAAIACFGVTGLPPGLLFPIAAVAGFGAIGSTPGLNALAATIYPTSLRSTGIGWSLGVGRVGGLVGPVLAGALLTTGWTSRGLFAAVAGVTAAAAVFVIWMSAAGRSR